MNSIIKESGGCLIVSICQQQYNYFQFQIQYGLLSALTCGWLQGIEEIVYLSLLINWIFDLFKTWHNLEINWSSCILFEHTRRL